VNATVPLHRWSAVRLARALATRELSVATLAGALIERSQALDPVLHAWASFDADAARERARALDRLPVRGPLFGVPLGVKDIIDTAGMATAYGSPIYAGHVPALDAACVSLAKAAGAWVLGKTASTEFANMQPAATRNPHDTAHTPGGSSSGSAAAVAAGLVPLAFGTQTAGSLIRPAAFCGVVAYKPSPGRIARSGVKLNSDTLDEVGVFARHVEDVVLLAGALGGGPLDTPRFVPRIGLVLTPQAEQLSGDMLRAMAASANRLSDGGARVQDLECPASFDALFEAHRVVQGFETARALAPELAYRRAQLSPVLAAFLEAGQRLSPEAYATALAQGRQARADIDLLFADVDVLLAPAAPGVAPRSLETTGDPMFSRPWQLLGCPCVALPAGQDAAGMPLGVQIIGRPHDDARTLAAAAWSLDALRGDQLLQ
jgi:Asp-tRNA(Asn)/Glu-tRNA(Gln) amidotransferase A subunit family amidase